MCKKIFSVLCIGIIFISILSPLKVKASGIGYNDNNNYVNGTLTNSQYRELLGLTSIAGYLQNGGEIVVPNDSSLSAQDLYDLVTGSLADIAINHLDDALEYIQWYANDRYLDINPNGFPLFEWHSKSEETQQLWKFGQDVYITCNEYLKNNVVSPIPDPNYQQYIDALNPQSMWWFTNNIQGNLTSPIYSEHSYFSCWISDSIIYLDNPIPFTNTIGSVMYKEIPLNLNINEINGIYYFDCPNYILDGTNQWSNNNVNYYRSLYRYNNYNMAGPSVNNINGVNGTTTTYNKSGTLQEVLEHLVKYFRNVNLYINGNPWSIVNNNYPLDIGGNTYLTNTDTPIYYNVPEGTRWNPNILKSILLNLLDIANNTNGLIKWVDVEEAFTDEYGNQALWTISIVRNDYDNLVNEQYPVGTIPNKIHGVTFPNDHLSSYTDEMVYITKNGGSNLIPTDILTILGACGVIILIAYLINRMLE